MDACGPGWHLQIARTTSDDGLANESLKSLSNCMLGDSTRSVGAHCCSHCLCYLSQMPDLEQSVCLVCIPSSSCETAEESHLHMTLQRTLAATTSDTPSMGEATKGIMQKARMAKDLYEQQAAIESQVKERSACSGLSICHFPKRLQCPLP